MTELNQAEREQKERMKRLVRFALFFIGLMLLWYGFDIAESV